MSTFTKSEENYIAHEVQLRLQDEKFKLMEKKLDHMDSKLNWIVGIVIGSIIIPVVLHLFRLI